MPPLCSSMSGFWSSNETLLLFKSQIHTWFYAKQEMWFLNQETSEPTKINCIIQNTHMQLILANCYIPGYDSVTSFRSFQVPTSHFFLQRTYDINFKIQQCNVLTRMILLKIFTLGSSTYCFWPSITCYICIIQSYDRIWNTLFQLYWAMHPIDYPANSTASRFSLYQQVLLTLQFSPLHAWLPQQ